MIQLFDRDMQTSGQSTSPLGVGKSTAEMKMKNTFQNWDFADTWEMEENVSYPMLQVENSGGGSCTGEPTLVYHHEDHLTGSNVDTDESGALNQVLDYYAFGATRIDEQYGNFNNDYKFTGKEKDAETGLYYYGARYYDSELGRFISRDTWEGELENPQSLNRYSYVLNNPLKYVDPSGNRVELVTRQMDYKSMPTQTFIQNIKRFFAQFGNHSFVRTIPDNPSDFGGVEKMTLGAGQDKGGILAKGYNNPNDFDPKTKIKEINVIQTPKGMTDSEHIGRILGTFATELIRGSGGSLDNIKNSFGIDLGLDSGGLQGGKIIEQNLQTPNKNDENDKDSKSSRK